MKTEEPEFLFKVTGYADGTSHIYIKKTPINRDKNSWLHPHGEAAAGIARMATAVVESVIRNYKRKAIEQYRKVTVISVQEIS